jgi:hypothetical protein
MDNVMTKGFCELNENEIMGIDGGWNGWQWTGGAACVIVGGAYATYSAVTFNAEGIVSGLGVASFGVENIYDSFFH